MFLNKTPCNLRYMLFECLGDNIAMTLQKEEIASQAKLAQRGDSGALARLCEFYYPLILSFMHFRVHPDCAEDLTSIVFTRIVKGITSLQGNFNGFIYKISRNVVIDHYRYNGKRSYVEYEDGVTVDLSEPKYGTISMFNVDMDLKTILDSLDEVARELIVLRFIQGCTSDEVSEIMGIKPGTVRAMQARILSKLRDSYRREV